MAPNKHSNYFSLIFSTMLSASFIVSAPNGHITAGSGEQAMAAVIQREALAAGTSGMILATENTPVSIATPKAIRVKLTSGNLSSSAITTAQRTKLEHYFSVLKHPVAFDPRVIEVLNLKWLGNPVNFLQFGGADDADLQMLHLHYFNRAQLDSKIILFLSIDKSRRITYGYLADENFNYVRGYVMSNGVARGLDEPEGRSGLTRELAWWGNEMENAPTDPPQSTASN